MKQSVHASREPDYNIAPAKTDTTIIPNIPKPALLTATGAPTITAAPGVDDPDAAPPVSLAPLPPLPPLVLLGVDEAVAELLPLHRISAGLTPLSM